MLTSAAHLHAVVRISQLMAAPSTPPLNVSLPCAMTPRQLGIGMDLISMAYARRKHLAGKLRVALAIGPYTSPQHNYDFFCTMKEAMTRPLDCGLPIPFEPFKGVPLGDEEHANHGPRPQANVDVCYNNQNSALYNLGLRRGRFE